MLWGEATTEEMCIGFVGVVKAGQDLTRGDANNLGEIFNRQWEQRREAAKPAQERVKAFKAKLKSEAEKKCAATDIQSDG